MLCKPRSVSPFANKVALLSKETSSETADTVKKVQGSGFKYKNIQVIFIQSKLMISNNMVLANPSYD